MDDFLWSFGSVGSHRSETELRAARRSRRLRRASRIRDRKQTEERFAQLEQEFAEATLLLRALSELCIEKGVFTGDEIVDKAVALDAADGKVDGRISEPSDDEQPS